jgi:hypothetical protein
MIVSLYFYVNGKRVNDCELEKATGMLIDDLIVKLADGSLKAAEVYKDG